MARFQPIYDIAELCSRKGLRQAVLCPGSRCAPLTLALARHPSIITRTFSDERSAGFVALGISQQLSQPALLLCTSGSAAYNFAPAVAEAFFSETPLIVFTADRPSEWVGQHDGQTIYQTEIFGKHVKQFFQLPQEYEHRDSQWAINRMVNEAINLATQEPKGPVHINMPFREPLYPGAEENISFSTSVRVLNAFPPDFKVSEEQARIVSSSWKKYQRVLIVGGQTERNDSLNEILDQLSRRNSIPAIGDIISNLHGAPTVLRRPDLFLSHTPEQIKKLLKPDLLITFGKSVISKSLKTFLRAFGPQEHWHIQPSGRIADTFQSITHTFNTTPAEFFSLLNNIDPDPSSEQKEFNQLWTKQELKAKQVAENFFLHSDFGEFSLVDSVLKTLPEKAELHLANSMSVRYANLVGLSQNSKASVYANRGTSGIDGCTSTMVGHALIAKERLHVLITGDLAFFYDRNAFWHKYPIQNLRVIVLNNHGGVIFKMIDGPGSLPESTEYFVTEQRLTAQHLCEEFGFTYIRASDANLKDQLNHFWSDTGTPKILEIETTAEDSQKTFEKLKLQIKQNYEA